LKDGTASELEATSTLEGISRSHGDIGCEEEEILLCTNRSQIVFVFTYLDVQSIKLRFMTCDGIL